MGGKNSYDSQGAVIFEDQFDIQQYVSDDLSAQEVLNIRETFEALAERTPSGELGVRRSTLK